MVITEVIVIVAVLAVMGLSIYQGLHISRERKRMKRKWEDRNL
jgi:hypothetical protein